MIPSHRPPTHPGEILLQEFLLPLELSQVALAGKLRVPIQRINTLVKGKRGRTCLRPGPPGPTCTASRAAP